VSSWELAYSLQPHSKIVKLVNLDDMHINYQVYLARIQLTNRQQDNTKTKTVIFIAPIAFFFGFRVEDITDHLSGKAADRALGELSLGTFFVRVVPLVALPDSHSTSGSGGAYKP